MELDSSCNINILENSMKSKNMLSDLFITNVDPTLSAININEDTNDGTQLMMYQTNDQLSFVDIKFNSDNSRMPLLTIPNRSIVFDHGDSYEKIDQEDITQHERVTSDIMEQGQISNNLVLLDDTSRNDLPESSQTFLLINNFNEVNENICDKEITEMKKTNKNDILESSQTFVLIDNQFHAINEKTCEEITEMIQTNNNDLPESSQTFVLIDNNFHGVNEKTCEETSEMNQTNNNDPSKSSQTFVVIDNNFHGVSEKTCDEEMAEMNQTNNNALPESSQTFVLIDNNVHAINEKTSEEITQMNQNEGTVP
ncbi:hypothetical protein WDU94_015216 [Cyamophila willieti]